MTDARPVLVQVVVVCAGRGAFVSRPDGKVSYFLSVSGQGPSRFLADIPMTKLPDACC
jgi:hypothetical protein